MYIIITYIIYTYIHVNIYPTHKGVAACIIMFVYIYVHALMLILEKVKHEMTTH